MSGLAPVKLAGADTSTIILVNPVVFPPYIYPVSTWELGLICTLSPGSNLTYSVQVTADQIPSAAGNWNNHDTLFNQTASANGNIAFPITGLRLVVTDYTAGSANLGVCMWP